MTKFLVFAALSVSLTSICLCNVLPGTSLKLLGGVDLMTENEFRNYNLVGNKKIDLSNLINEEATSTAAPNSPPLEFTKFVCASKQLVAGTLIRVHYLACAQTNGECSTPEKVKCVAKMYLVPWLIGSAGASDITVLCGDQLSKSNDINFGNCHEDLTRRPKRDISDNQFSNSILVMGQPVGATNYKYDKDVKAMFDRFLEVYQRDYSEGQTMETYQQKYEIFRKNLQLVAELNKLEQGTAVYGITKFMDYSEEEYAKYLAPGFTKKLVDIRKDDLSGLDTESIPDLVDWRKKGAVTPVKNQGQCGSCWAFSTTGNIEGQWFLKKKALVSLSEQELVDCDSLDQGCGGGLPSNAYKSIEKLGGLETESAYPYEGENDKCNLKRSAIKVYINDSVALPTDEGKLAAWLAQNGPISIGINANLMQFYWGGISHPWKIFCNPSSLDHGVLIVGYGTENGTPYWIIKNSWGADWGEEGYYRIYRGDGSCGVNKMATSSIID